MSKSMVGATGGLSATDKAKLIPENIRYGVTVGKVRGTLGANLIVTGDVLCQKMGTNSSTSAANSTWQVLQQDESFAVSGATITCNKAGTYTYEFRAVTGNVWNGEGRAYLRKNGSNVTSVGSTKGVLAKTETGTMELAEGDTVTAYLYARAGVNDWSGNSEVYVEHLKLSLEK